MPTVQPEPHIAARVEKLRRVMREKKVDALLITSFSDVSYLTGFEGEDSFTLITPESALLLSDFRYTEQISREAPWIKPVMRTKAMWETVGTQIKKLKIRKLGVQSEALTVRQLGLLQKGLPKRRGIKITPVDEAVIGLRHVKDEHEIQIIEQAVAIAEHAFETVKAHFRTGETENHIASRLTHEMRKLDAQGASFDTIVAAGANGSLPHYRPGRVKVQNNMAVLVDWGARARGYCSDLTRMIFVGAVPEKIREIYGIVLEAQLAAIDAIKPGEKALRVDRVARDIIKKAGYGKNFGHSLGHGFGRDVHEAIAMSRQSKVVLQPGMVVTVEPGIYLPGIGGVRIEDDVLVTEHGCRVLSHLPKTLDSAHL